jgi:formylglycine-generating enzyme required for sulfatase activity
MTLTVSQLKQIARVAHSPDAGFVELVGLAGLDPVTAFQRTTLRGDLSNQDLAGFDFTGATFAETCDLTDADFSHTLGVTPAMLAHAKGQTTVKRPRAWFWANGKPPSWAEDWEHDTNGAWSAFRVPGTDVVQKMRWCPPGDFMMGAADDDKDADDDERPQHRVAFEQGFWMLDTTVTEALWTAVTGDKPRSERGPAMPVTDVSWPDAQSFAEQLNALLPGLALGLPSEAMWEYACRAGTATPYSFGKTVTRRQVRYGGKVEAGPAAAGSLPANPWGLYEMHGNVYEWCDDGWVDNYRDAPPDGAAWQPDGSAFRVVRGGCWFVDARRVRASYRGRGDPRYRSDRFGFRLARVRTSSAERPAEPDRVR